MNVLLEGIELGRHKDMKCVIAMDKAVSEKPFAIIYTFRYRFIKDVKSIIPLPGLEPGPPRPKPDVHQTITEDLSAVRATQSWPQRFLSILEFEIKTFLLIFTNKCILNFNFSRKCRHLEYYRCSF